MPVPIERLFPRLGESDFQVTSPRVATYNCVAWAAGDTRRWWWPAESPFGYWPSGVTREESLASFLAAFSTLGYRLCEDGALDPDQEKVAIFASDDGVPTHMARQLPDGSWTSKLGRLEDIAHGDVHAVGGSDYGEVAAYLQRQRL